MIPAAAGGVTLRGESGDRICPAHVWIRGQMILWALFQLISVPLILKGGRLYTDFSRPFDAENPLLSVTVVYAAACAVLTAAGLYVWYRRIRKDGMCMFGKREKAAEESVWCRVFRIAFWVILLFQLVMAVCMTYADGDDAFYVAVASIAQESNTMYQKLPYTGGTTGLDIRHGLAPFPVWLAFLSHISGIRTVTVAHVAAPLMLIPMTYGIYHMIGCELCKDSREKLPLFLVFTEFLVLFGDYSFSSVENFMIARSRQGKAALGSIVIPMVIFLFLEILKKVQENKKTDLILWILLASCVMTGCLCSTLGAVLLCMITGLTAVCGAVCYRRWRILIPMAVCCIPAVCYAVIYLLAE